jgi:hypothetical protein
LTVGGHAAAFPSQFISRKETFMEVYKRTVTEKRRAANRAAAAHSTGPRTEEGKRRSAFNSFKHGLYATQDSTIRQAFDRSGVDLAQYDQLHRDLAASLQPQDPMQALLVEDLVRFYWLKNLSQRAAGAPLRSISLRVRPAPTRSPAHRACAQRPGRRRPGLVAGR